MNVTEGLPGAFEPTHWFLAFFERTESWWINLLAWGRFAHVSAFAYVPGARVWLWYDVHWRGTTIILLPHDDFCARIGALTRDATVIRLEKQAAGPMPIFTRPGFYCVPAVKHLLGLRCVAATPDQLYRFALKNGGILLSGCESAATAARSDAADRAGEGSG